LSGLKRFMNKAENFGGGRGFVTDKNLQAAAQGKRDRAQDAIFANAQMPDDAALKKAQRTKAASRRGSRVSSVLTDQDKLGG